MIIRECRAILEQMKNKERTNWINFTGERR